MTKGGDRKGRGKYTRIVENDKFAVHVLDPREDRRDNVRLTLSSDDGECVHHHLRAYEVARLVAALQAALAFGPEIPTPRATAHVR